MFGSAATPVQHSNAFARARDAKVCWLLTNHPVTASMLVRLGLFPTTKKALKRLNRLVARRKIRRIGTICRRVGRPEHVYCRWCSSATQLVHEIELTELCFRVDAGSIVRGPHVTDARVRPDAELQIDGQTYYLELDRGTMSHAQIAGRFQLYEGCPHFSLWVCSTSDRMETLRKRAEMIRRTALFTTYAQAMASAHSAIWMDVHGDRVALPREGEMGGKNPGENGGNLSPPGCGAPVDSGN